MEVGAGGVWIFTIHLDITVVIGHSLLLLLLVYIPP